MKHPLAFLNHKAKMIFWLFQLAAGMGRSDLKEQLNSNQ
jgi:hypothetical protein